MQLQVSDNRRFLQLGDGAPFFLLGDTAWELFHCTTRDEADFYLETRAAQGFNTIYAVVLAEHDGLRVPNSNGDLPLHDLDPTRPNEAYSAHVDYVVQKADSLGLWIALLPTWGDKWNEPEPSPERKTTGVIFTPENAAAYGEYVGKRYAKSPIIWVLGGDRAVENATQHAIIDAMAHGLTRGDGGRGLKTFHPRGGRSSTHYFHDSDWLDFHMLQSGHVGRDVANYDLIARDYAMKPIKPVSTANRATKII